MPVESIDQNSWSQGEIGPYMAGRADNPIYGRAGSVIENWVILPHGGLMRRAGFEFVAEIDAGNADEIRFAKFDFQKTQQYVLVLTDKSCAIYYNKQLATTIETPWVGDELRGVRYAQSGDTVVMVHYNHAPRLLERLGSHTSWAISEIEFDNLPYFRYNLEQSLTPSATTGSITLTLSPTDPYWTAGHVDVQVKLNSGTANITGFQQNATGGTAYSSAGTAANAFDSNPATTCNAGATGWIGYGWGAAKAVRVIGIKSVATATVTLLVETDDNSSFSSPAMIVTYTNLELVADTWVYIDVPEHTGETHARIRLTSGTLDVKDVVFNEGVVVTANVVANLSGTAADKAWKEEAWSEAHGFPQSTGFHGNRLYFGGTRDAPSTILASKTNDFFNFDDSNTNDDNAFVLTFSTDQVHLTRDLKSQQNLKVFTSDGEAELIGGENGITPTSVRIEFQSSYGISDIPVVEVDGELIFSTANNKEIRSFVYSLNKDRYVADNKTIVAHHLFKKEQTPRAVAYLSSYKDTQANFLFVPRSDGELCVLTIDTEREVKAWSRWITAGSFKDAVVVSTDHGDGYRIDTLYVVVERATGIFLEAWTEEKIYTDHWYIGTADPAKATWSGLRTLIGQEVQIVGDGLVQESQTVQGTVNAASVVAGGTGYATNNILTVVGGTGTAATLRVTGQSGGVITTVSVETAGNYTVPPPNPVSVTGGAGSGATFNLTVGTFTIPNEVETIAAGLGYESRMETMDLTIVAGPKILRGEPITLKKAIVNLHETLALKIDGQSVRFRQLGDELLDQPLIEFTGQKEKRIGGIGRTPVVTLSVDEPLPCTVLALKTNVKIGLPTAMR